MIVGAPKEIKNKEFRAGLTPDCVRELSRSGHTILVQQNIGADIGFNNEHYIEAGATIVETAEDIYRRSEMIVKVKEPQPDECRQLREGQILFTYLHLAPDPLQAGLLIESGASCIAYETVTSPGGGLPLLTPMSEVAGRMAVQAGCHSLENAQGGSGTLLGGVPGVRPAKVLVIGGGVVGINAARMAAGLGADVTLLDKSIARLKEIDALYASQVKTIFSTKDTIERCAREADLVIGAVLVPGATAPKLISRELVSKMKRGAVLVDVAIDQGGCFETSKPTTHENPCYIVDGIVHYCVANMPGGVALTSTVALTNATLPYVLKIANEGLQKALLQDPHLMNGLNVHKGKVTHAAVAEALGMNFVTPSEALRN